MRHSFSIYFYLKRRKLQKDSKSTIMLRIIVNNKAADVSLKTSILHEHWDKQNRRVSDMNPEAHDINTYLNKVSSGKIGVCCHSGLAERNAEYHVNFIFYRD